MLLTANLLMWMHELSESVHVRNVCRLPHTPDLKSEWRETVCALLIQSALHEIRVDRPGMTHGTINSLTVSCANGQN